MKRLILIPLFSATIVALGLLFLAVPNLELVTFTCFLAGYLLGTRDGVAAAALGEGLYSFSNPMGAAPLPLLIAQILGMSLAAFIGSLTAGNLRRFYGFLKIDQSNKFPWKSSLLFGILGLLITLIFDLLTTASFLIFAGLSMKEFVAILVSRLLFGLHFYLLHIGSNAVIFAVLLPMTIPRLENWLLLAQRKR